jgi:hypothetical protein
LSEHHAIIVAKVTKEQVAIAILEILAKHSTSNFHFPFCRGWVMAAICTSRPNHVDTLYWNCWRSSIALTHYQENNGNCVLYWDKAAYAWDSASKPKDGEYFAE